MKRARRILALVMLGAGCVAPAPDPAPADLDPVLGGVDAEVGDGGADAAAVPPQRDLGLLVPWKAVNLIGPGPLVWEEYDYRPRAEGGFREDIDATLDRLRGLGVRQVLIHALHAWSVESAPYPGTGLRTTVYYRADYRPDDPSTWGKVARTARGDMGLVPWNPPPSWEQPPRLLGPLELAARGRQVVTDMLGAVRRHGLIPVLINEVHLTPAETGAPDAGSFVFTDPSRAFDPFYRQYRDYLVEMTRVAARGGAALFILGSEHPYVAGAGQSTFVDGSRMVDRRALIAGKWREILAAVRAAAREEGRPDLMFSYAEINPFYEDRPITGERVPVWSAVPFWDDLDAVSINYYHPGRFTDGKGTYDTAPKTADDMVAYGEAYSFRAKTSVVPNLADLRDYFEGQRGDSLLTRPVLLAGDGCTATYLGAANPASPPFLRLGTQPDVTEQRNLYEAHFRLAEKHGGAWLAGVGLWQVPPTGRWGGAWDGSAAGRYMQGAAYFNFLGTATEDVVRRYFARWHEAPGSQ